MRIACVGGGPAGLYFAILMKRRDATSEVTVYERNPPKRTQGWGVVYWNDLVESLQAADSTSAAAICANSVKWTDQGLHLRGRWTLHSGRGGYGIGRHRLLELLTARAIELGVRVVYDTDICDVRQVCHADLVVAADGSGSALRRNAADRFSTSISTGRNKYIWLGSTKVLDTFTFALVRTPAGWIWFHGYAHDGETSTCVVECPPETWSGLGFDRCDARQAVDMLEPLFADVLEDHPLLLGESSWLNFRTVRNEHWHDGNLVLMGDAAHTTHFTIGSGTKLALQDAIALSESLGEHHDLETALSAYGQGRREALRQPQSEARCSAAWFENIERYVGLGDIQLFLLLRERRSPLLARIPPLLYYRLHMLAEKVPALRRLRRWIGPPARAVYSRWRY
ncbi:FAD-dependent monooxygenase [Devosia nitrariae]|uniref:FAD-binding monooxygenase n=1 Tax=Devosia nitrariae TaxID=2071872 RepID=A0ABQ5W0G8_9HYPH|nr:FAD-dependent monooxygenase [Devosia nitrariae]GLQ53552.1 FAD-binding monooxygenase [Devosia nitrariae]